MMLISDAELRIACDCPACDKPARYIVKLICAIPYRRLYCHVHTAELLQRAADCLRDNESLHDFIETEHIHTGAVVNG